MTRTDAMEQRRVWRRTVSESNSRSLEMHSSCERYSSNRMERASGDEAGTQPRKMMSLVLRMSLAPVSDSRVSARLRVAVAAKMTGRLAKRRAMTPAQGRVGVKRRVRLVAWLRSFD